MEIITKIVAMQKRSKLWQKKGFAIGFVPTMGALHEGHLSLIQRAKRDCDKVAVSIFVNPAQFGPREDYARYPRPFGKDVRMCRKAGVDVVFAPAVSEMYPEDFQTKVSVGGLSQWLCGPFRPGHFDGVATVVAKLFQAVQPDCAYFGLKDYQQFLIVKKMAEDLNMPVQIIGCPTVREPDGLAKSSRNAYLSAQERQEAARLYQAMRHVEDLIKQGRIKKVLSLERSLRQKISTMESKIKIDYVTLCDPQTLEPLTHVRGPVLAAFAVKIGKTRLIDNLLIKP